MLRSRQSCFVFGLSCMLLGVVCLVPALGSGEDEVDVLKRVSHDVEYLASDELEGRGPGTEGLEIAARYIRDEFARLGLKGGAADGSFMQPFDIPMDNKVKEDGTKLELNYDGEALVLKLGKDFQPQNIGGPGKLSAPLVFVGYGISAADKKYEEYKDVDVEGKILVMIRREPRQGKNPFGNSNSTGTSPHASIRTKLRIAKDQKAAAILMVNDPHTTKKDKKDSLATSNAFGRGNMGIPFAHVTQAQLNRVLKASPLVTKDGKTLSNFEEVEDHVNATMEPVSQPIKGWTANLSCAFERVKADVVNVVGVLEGEGPLANETIVIGAHYDHLGYGGFGSRAPGVRAVHNGADDNASGTAAIMELARRFATRDKKPSRRLVFIAFSAEERGLIGSNYYVANPLFPLDETVAMFNFDMIGTVRNNELSVGGIGSAKEFSALVDGAAENSKLKIKKQHRSIGGSDHLGFSRKQIPAVHFFSGLTSVYHTPDDDFEDLNMDGVVQSIDFAEDFIGATVELDKRPQYASSNTAARRTGNARPGMAYLGVTPDYAGEGGNGLLVTDVAANSPAAKGGMKKDDVIVKFGDLEVKGIQELATGLRSNRPGQTVTIVVKRGDKEVTCKVTLGRPQGGN